MELAKRYRSVKFQAETLRAADATLDTLLSPEDKKKAAEFSISTEGRTLRIFLPGETWSHDSTDEFFADYRRADLTDATFAHSHSLFDRSLRVSFDRNLGTTVSVEAPTRVEIHKVFDVFETGLADSTRFEKPAAPPSPPPTIFVGHGRSPLWRDLKDHLHEQHGYEVEAYEVGARAGHTVRDILEEMLEGSSFALLVMTGEDLDAEGGLHVRENVIHEAGLFQGHLGFARAIILLEHGTQEFSNIQGIHQIRFATGNIRETYGDVLATLRREFDT